MPFGLFEKKKEISKEEEKSQETAAEETKAPEFNFESPEIPDEEDVLAEAQASLGEDNALKKKKRFKFSFGARKMSKDKRVILRNLSLLLASGMGISSALQSISRNIKKKGLKKRLEKIVVDIEGGESLWKAFDNQEFLPEFLISMIKIGEASGNLSAKITNTVESLDKEAKRKGQLKSALIYPVIVLSIAVIISLGMSIFVIPQLAQVFEDLDVELPWITKQLIAFGDFAEANWYWFVPTVLVSILTVIYFVFIFGKTKFIGQWIMFHAPIFKLLIKYTEVSRFCYNLGMLMKSGITVTAALDVLSEMHDYYMYKDFTLQLSQEVRQGKSFSKAFQHNKKKVDYLFPATAQEMIISGEESGSLTNVLHVLGDNFETESEEISRNMSTLLEPFMLLLIFGAVMFLGVAILIPIFDLVGGFDTSPGAETPGEI